MSNNTENRAVAIKVSGVRKRYKLGQIGGGTLQGDLQSWWARIRGKEDPNSKIGTDQRLVGQTFMALNGIDLTVYEGEALGIIGGNGAGKSTLLKILSRVTAPTEGEIDIYGRITSMLEVGTGFNTEMTGRENVYLNGAILGMTKAEIDAKMDEIIKFSEVGDFIDTPVKRYSSGMYVKLAFSVAAHLDSEIMIMDEVLAVGDMAFQRKCLERMRHAAKEEGRTVLYVSHNMNTIRQLCDRCIVLDQGKLIFSGSVEEAIEFYMGKAAVSPPLVKLGEMKVKKPKSCLEGVRFVSAEVVDNNAWTVSVGKKLRYKLTVKATKDVKNIGYRAELMAANKTPVSAISAPAIINCKAGEETSVIVEMDTSLLVPGKYIITPVLYSVNEYGGWAFYDHVSEGINFDVENETGFNENIPWDQIWWGNVKLPNMDKIEE